MPTPNTLKYLDRMERWMLDNLEVVNGQAVRNGQPVAANSGTLLLICSYIDALGGYLCGRATETFGHHRASNKRGFENFVWSYMPRFRAAALTAKGTEIRRTVTVDRCAPGCSARRPAVKRKKLNFCEMLYTLYRNGLVHEFLPRSWAGYARGTRVCVCWDSRRRRLVVDLDELVGDFREALAGYCADVRNDRAVRSRFRERLRFVVRR